MQTRKKYYQQRTTCLTFDRIREEVLMKEDLLIGNTKKPPKSKAEMMQAMRQRRKEEFVMER